LSSTEIVSPIESYIDQDILDQEATFRVINGWEVEKYRYDYHVQAFGGSKACGGVLIAKNIILTAAHCAGGFQYAYLGMYKWYDSDNYKEKIKVLQEIPHPDFDVDTFYSDFMLVVLEEESRFPPVCISGDPNVLIPGYSKLHVLGFGNTEETGSLSYTFREVDLEYISNTACQSLYRQHQIHDNMMCCDSSKLGKDACQGDSGGPLIIKGDSADEDVVVGIVSWGVGCARYPGVYARISNEMSWISQKVSELGGTLAPCKGVTQTPTRSPIKSPIKSPTFAEMPSQKKLEETLSCVRDNGNFRWSGKTCSQLANTDYWNACQNLSIRTNCPVSCSCHVSAAGTMEGCQDNEKFSYKGNNCEWVRQNISTCHKRSWPSGKLVRDHCQKSCGLCTRRNCGVRDNLNFMFKNNIRRRCRNWVKNLPNKRCRNNLIKANCPVTCACYWRNSETTGG